MQKLYLEFSLFLMELKWCNKRRHTAKSTKPRHSMREDLDRSRWKLIDTHNTVQSLEMLTIFDLHSFSKANGGSTNANR